MTERDPLPDLDELGVDRGSQHVRPHPQLPGRGQDRARLPHRVGRGQQQQPLGVLRQDAEALRELGLQLALEATACHVEATGEFRRAHAVWQLEEGERVAAGLGHDPVADVLVQPSGDGPIEQGARVLLTEPTEPDLRQTVERRHAGRLTHREHDRHRFSEQPPRDEAQDLSGDAIQPLRVVDQAQQRLVFGDCGHQAQHRHGDHERVGRIARGRPQRDPQRSALRRRERVDPGKERRAQLVHGRERELHLGFDARQLGDAEPGRLMGAVAQQRRLARPGLAADHQRRAPTPPDAAQESVQQFALGGSAQQRGRPARGHPRSLRPAARAQNQPDSSAFPRSSPACPRAP